MCLCTVWSTCTATCTNCTRTLARPATHTATLGQSVVIATGGGGGGEGVVCSNCSSNFNAGNCGMGWYGKCIGWGSGDEYRCAYCNCNCNCCCLCVRVMHAPQFKYYMAYQMEWRSTFPSLISTMMMMMMIPHKRTRGPGGGVGEGCGCGVQTAFGQTTTAPQCEFCCPGLSSIFTLQFSLCVYCICLMFSWAENRRRMHRGRRRPELGYMENRRRKGHSWSPILIYWSGLRNTWYTYIYLECTGGTASRTPIQLQPPHHPSLRQTHDDDFAAASCAKPANQNPQPRKCKREWERRVGKRIDITLNTQR